MRTKEDHTVHDELIENVPTNFLKEFYSKKCGVTFRSKLMEAPFFDVNQQLPMDIMHVFFRRCTGVQDKVFVETLHR